MTRRRRVERTVSAGTARPGQDGACRSSDDPKDHGTRLTGVPCERWQGLQAILPRRELSPVDAPTEAEAVAPGAVLIDEAADLHVAHAPPARGLAYTVSGCRTSVPWALDSGPERQH